MHDYPFSKTETRGYRALHRWRVLDPSLTKEEVDSRVGRCGEKAITAAARARLHALIEWAELFWDRY